MEKPYEIFPADEADAPTYLADLLEYQGRSSETPWATKQDLLVQDECHIADIVSGTQESMESDMLEDRSYFPEICSKEESTEAENYSATSLDYEALEYPLRDKIVEADESSSPRTQVASSGSKSEDSSSFDTGDPGGLSAEDSAYEASFDANTIYSEYCSEYAQTSSCDQRTASFRNGIGNHLSNKQRHKYSFFPTQKEVQKPPTTAGIDLEHLKAVFHFERPKAEKELQLKRTTFSNLSRHYGISKWPFRTIRDARNRMEANDVLLRNRSLSKSRHRKLLEQQKQLKDVIKLIYSDPRQSRDTNTLAVLLSKVAQRNPHDHSEL